jgi:hypothetical protein
MTLETARNAGLAILAGAVAAAIVIAWVVKAIVSKLLALAVMAGVVIAVWSQRESLQECADRVGATLAAGAVDDTTCTFFGRDVTVGSPLD